MTQVIIHKGFKNVVFENSLVGILLAIFKNKFCEFDIMFDHHQWKICHDSSKLTVYHTELSVLINYLKQYQHHVKNNIIIDVKWDFIYNQKDNLEGAVLQLKEMLVGMKKFPFWLQASHPVLLTIFSKHQFHTIGKIGLNVSTVMEFHQYKGYIDYAMISMSDFQIEDIKKMYQEKLLYGYTCTDLINLSNYKHLLPYLAGIVCDVSI